jgi:hypothetical protein
MLHQTGSATIASDGALRGNLDAESVSRKNLPFNMETWKHGVKGGCDIS